VFHTISFARLCDDPLAHLNHDFPTRLQKPIDTPFGLYVDGFSRQQHNFGPFDPIRAKMKDLAAAS
jgi:thiosulfate dehydrogenase